MMRKHCDRLLALLMALLMALSLAACGGAQTGAEDAPAGDAQAEDVQTEDAQTEDAGEDAQDEDGQTEDAGDEAPVEKSITLTVTYEDGSSDEYIIETDAEHLKEAAELAVTLEGEESDYGFTVTAVNGVEADFTDGSNAYWAIYVNGEYGMYAIDAQPIADGDQFALVYETYAG